MRGCAMDVFKPSWDGYVLESAGNPENKIALTAHFFLAAQRQDPVPSLNSSALEYPPGPDYQLYQAVRLTRPAVVEGVTIQAHEPPPGTSHIFYRDEDYEAGLTRARTEVPAGTLLMRAFHQASGREAGVAEGPWLALLPRQQGFQNMQRMEAPVAESSLRTNFSSTHQASFQRFFLRSWTDATQKQAHAADIRVQERLGLILPQSCFGRWMSMIFG